MAEHGGRPAILVVTGSSPMSHPPVGINTYSHTCRLAVIDLRSRKILKSEEFTDEDPARQQIELVSNRLTTPSGHVLLRTQVRQSIEKLASAAHSTRQNRP